MKYDGKSLLFSPMESVYNNDVDLKFHDETTMLIINGLLQAKDSKLPLNRTIIGTDSVV